MLTIIEKPFYQKKYLPLFDVYLQKFNLLLKFNLLS